MKYYYKISRFKTLTYIVMTVLRILYKILRQKRFLELISEFGYRRTMYKYSLKGVSYGIGTILYSVKVSQSLKGDKFIIGRNCTLTNCTLLGHDASPSLFIPDLIVDERVYVPGSRKSYREKIIIGDNVFIGAGAIVLPGIIIGDNVVVGAGTIVTKNIKSGSVVVGNPGRKISDTSEYVEKYKDIFQNNPEFF